MASVVITAYSRSAAAQDISAHSFDDWALWNSGTGSGTSVAPDQRKSGGGSTIGSLTCTSGTLDGFTAAAASMAWSGGTPTASGSNTNGCYNTFGATGADASVTLPASTATREALYYIDAYGSNVVLTATLSDGSAGPATDSSMTNGVGDVSSGYFTVTYSASSTTTLTLKAVGTTAIGGYADVEVRGIGWRFTATGTTVTPGVGTLALSGFAPTVARTANQAVAPGVGSLTLTGFAPTVSQSVGLNLTPGVAALALTGYAPSVARTANQSLTPGAGSLTLTGYAPTISQPHGVAPGVGTLSLTGFAPTVAQSANQGVNPGVGSLSLTGYAPSIGQTANQALVPGVGALSITGFAPVVTVASASVSLVPGVGVLTVAGYAPDVAQSGAVVAEPQSYPGTARKRKPRFDFSPAKVQPEEIERPAAPVKVEKPKPVVPDALADVVRSLETAQDFTAELLVEQQAEQKRLKIEAKRLDEENDEESIATLMAMLM